MENIENNAEQDARPWGLLGTILFSGLIIAAVILSQLAYVIYHIGTLNEAGAAGIQLPQHEIAQKLATSGDFFAMATIIQAITAVTLIIVFAAMKKGISVADYLGLRGVPARTMILWVIAAMALASLGDLLTYLLGYPVIPKVFVDMHNNTTSLPIFWIAVVIAAPLVEEAFFRGFLFEGLRHSLIGPMGAVLITSVLWGAMHVQYEYYLMAFIVLIGFLLGYVKLKTNSLYLTIAMHFAVNLMATTQMEYYFRYWQPA